MLFAFHSPVNIGSPFVAEVLEPAYKDDELRFLGLIFISGLLSKCQ